MKYKRIGNKKRFIKLASHGGVLMELIIWWNIYGGFTSTFYARRCKLFKCTILFRIKEGKWGAGYDNLLGAFVNIKTCSVKNRIPTWLLQFIFRAPSACQLHFLKMSHKVKKCIKITTKGISGYGISLDLNCHFMPLWKITIDYDNKVLLWSSLKHTKFLLPFPPLPPFQYI